MVPRKSNSTRSSGVSTGLSLKRRRSSHPMCHKSRQQRTLLILTKNSWLSQPLKPYSRIAPCCELIVTMKPSSIFHMSTKVSLQIFAQLKWWALVAATALWSLTQRMIRGLPILSYRRTRSTWAIKLNFPLARTTSNRKRKTSKAKGAKLTRVFMETLITNLNRSSKEWVHRPPPPPLGTLTTFDKQHQTNQETYLIIHQYLGSGFWGFGVLGLWR